VVREPHGISHGKRNPSPMESLTGPAAFVLFSRQSTTLCGRLATTMPKQHADRIELVYGSLDMLVLRTLLWGPTHGHGIAKSIERMSEDTLKVEHGSLYPALQRLQQEGWVTAEWGVSKNNQRAKYYRLTAAGRRKLVAETSRWERFVQAVTRVLRPAESEEGQ
jgi:PadR family transcriptional regulator, regulatory protein PadR